MQLNNIVNPLTPRYQNVFSSHICPYISYDVSLENLSKIVTLFLKKTSGAI